MRTDMPKKDRNALIGLVLVAVAFMVWVIHSSFIQNYATDVEEVYEPFPFFDELYSAFWSGYLKLPFVERGYIAWGSMMTLSVIGFFVIRKIPAILQWTLLPTFYIATYQFNGQSINGGFQIMSSDMALSGFVNMLFTLIWIILWGGLAAFVAVILFFGFGGALGSVGSVVKPALDEYERAERDEYIKSLRHKKSNLESERDSIITSNEVFGIPTGNNLSPSELEHNRRRHNRLSKEIEEMEDNLKKFDDK